MPARLLGQQQLLEPDPSRRLVVPPGHYSWWGIDPSTTRVAVAYASNSGEEAPRGARTAIFARSQGAARLSEIYRETKRFVLELAGEWPRPGIVLIEQPSGHNVHPELERAAGLIQTAAFDALSGAYGRHVKIEWVTPGHWKKTACGRGNIYKRRGEEYGVLRWARANGYRGDSYDEADALGIAECARREIELLER